MAAELGGNSKIPLGCFHVPVTGKSHDVGNIAARLQKAGEERRPEFMGMSSHDAGLCSDALDDLVNMRVAFVANSWEYPPSGAWYSLEGLGEAVAQLNPTLFPGLGREALFGFGSYEQDLLIEVEVIPHEVAELLLAKSRIEECEQDRALDRISGFEHTLDFFVGVNLRRFFNDLARLDLGCEIFL